MNHYKRQLLKLCLLNGLLYSTQAISNQLSAVYRMIVPFEPGGLSDNFGRAVALGLKQQMRGNWVVDNIPGAGGAVGAMRVAQTANPAQQLLHGGAGTFRNYGNGSNPSVAFDSLRELQAVAVIGEVPTLLVTLTKHPAKSLKKYLNELKISKQPFVYGTPGLGTTSHVLGALLAQQIGIESQIIPYKGGAPTLRGLLSGEIPMAFLDPSPVASLLASGQLKCLGMSSSSPYPALRNYPTFQSQGLIENVSIWSGFFVSNKITVIDYRYWSTQLQKLTESGFLDKPMQTGFIKPLAFYGSAAQEYVFEDVNRFQVMSKSLRIYPF